MLGTGSWDKEFCGVALTLTLIFLGGSWEVVWLAFFAVEAGCGERVWLVRDFVAFLLKRFIGGGGLRVVPSDGDGAFWWH